MHHDHTWLRRPAIVLLAGQALLYLAIGASNVADVLGSALGWSEGAWRSGNVSWIEAVIDAGRLHVGDARAWAYATVCGAAVLELAAGIAFAAATIAWFTDPARVRRWCGVAVSAALTVMLGLAFGTELFITYEKQGWSEFVLLALLATITWGAVVLAPDPSPTDPPAGSR